jgi:hypothetical protein
VVVKKEKTVKYKISKKKEEDVKLEEGEPIVLDED